MRLVDGRELTEAEFDAALTLKQRLDAKRDPHLPVMPAEELRSRFENDRTGLARHERVVALSDGDSPEALAIGHIELTLDPANAQLAEFEITPADDEVMRFVLAELLARAAHNNRSSIIIFGDYSEEANVFWNSLGADLRYTEQESSLTLDAVDADLMQKWVDAAPDGFELAFWSRECPSELMYTQVAVANAMNDAPTDDLDIADTIVDESIITAGNKYRLALGLECHGVLALASDGSAAGTTEIFLNLHRPAASWQWITVVLPEYRGQRIGRWLKAAMWQWLRETHPEVTALHTGNAASNSFMLAINTDMGFVPTHLTACWQTERSVLEDAVSAVGVL